VCELICIVGEDHTSRTTIARILQDRGYDVAQFASADYFIRDSVGGIDANCIVLDVNLLDFRGMDLQGRLAALGNSAPIIYLTGLVDVKTTVRVIKAGAEDVLTKPVPEQVLIDSIARALEKFQLEQPVREWRRGARQLLEGLTTREREVFDRMIHGSGNKQSARELGISERTIKAHRQRIFQKLHARTVADLVLLAERLGMMGANDVIYGNGLAGSYV